jgi:hypothetical protein
MLMAKPDCDQTPCRCGEPEPGCLWFFWNRGGEPEWAPALRQILSEALTIAGIPDNPQDAK